MTAIALDTSVSVPYLQSSHDAHAVVRQRLSGRERWLTAHSLAETYSVLTRLPADARLDAADAVTLINAELPKVTTLEQRLAVTIHQTLAEAGIIGGAVHDALVGLAARQAGLPLATRDARAKTTYDALGVTVEVIA